LSLLVRSKPYTAKQSDLYLDTVLKALPSLLTVAHRPRQHLRIDEAVRPVGVVRRTGPAALRHLAQHSEHWETRTVNGLRAARLLAKVVDDDLNLYENRFVVTLIQLLRARTDKLAALADVAFSQAQSAIDIEGYVEELRDYRAQKMLETLLPSSTGEDMLNELCLYDALIKKAHVILRALSECEDTRLYRTLKRVAPVQEPIMPTNILTMDPHYRALFNLWQDLRRLVPEDEGTGELPTSMEAAYVSYCQIITLVAVQHAGFEPQNGEKQICLEKKPQGCTVVSGAFVNRDWVITLESKRQRVFGDAIALHFRRKLTALFNLPVSVTRPLIPSELSHICHYVDGQIEFLDRPTEPELTKLSELVHQSTRTAHRGARRSSHDEGVIWKSFVSDQVRPNLPKRVHFDILLVPVLSGIGAGAYDLEKNSELMLDEALREVDGGKYRSLLLLAPVTSREVDAATPGFVIRRLLNFGDSYFSGDAERWGRELTGILPVSPWVLSSLQRIDRLIGIRTLASDIKTRHWATNCPVCSSSYLTAEEQGEYYSCQCQQCRSLWGISACTCGHRFPWLRLRRRDKVQNFGEMPYGQWVERVEAAAGTIAFPAFCESSGARPAAIPICPKCGRCARQKELFSGCPRCIAHEQERESSQQDSVEINS
jgi:hypothetical protein